MLKRGQWHDLNTRLLHSVSNEKTDEERENQRAIFELNSKIEKEQDDEDTDMFIRLIKIRQFLWA